MRNAIGFVRRNWLILLAGAILLLPSALDLPALSGALGAVSHTTSAFLDLLGVVVTAGIITTWSKRRADDRDRRRFHGLAAIAFNTLSQTVNDVGRLILAPPLGVDLFAAGIPGCTEHEHRQQLAILHDLGVRPQRTPRLGYWKDVDEVRLAAALEVLAIDARFVGVMFRATSSARRRLQASLADWAPVMISIPEASERLNRGWLLAGQLVRSLEAWRAVSNAIADGAQQEQLDREVARAIAEFHGAVDRYREWLPELVAFAEISTLGFTDEDPDLHPLIVAGRTFRA